MERRYIRTVNQEITQIYKYGVRKAKGKYELRFATNVKKMTKKWYLGMSEQEKSQRNGCLEILSVLFGEGGKKGS